MEILVYSFPLLEGYRDLGRGMAQPGSAPALGAGSRGFESLCPDQSFQHFTATGVFLNF